MTASEQKRVWGSAVDLHRGKRWGEVVGKFGSLGLAVAIVVFLIVDGAWSLADAGRVIWPGIILGVILGVVVATVVALGLRNHLGEKIPGVTPDVKAMARLRDVVDNTGLVMGVQEVSVKVVESLGINAVLVSRAKGATELIVTRGAVEGCSMLQLEALVARELSAVRLGILNIRAPLAVFDRLMTVVFNRPPRWSVWQREYATLMDSAALVVTRFPPALADVLERAAHDGQRTTAISGIPPWMMLFPPGIGEARDDAELRVQFLREELWQSSSVK